MPSRFSPNFSLQRLVDFFGNGVQLPMAGAGDHEKIIEHRRQFAQIEQNDVLPAIILGDLGGGGGDLQAALRALRGTVCPARFGDCQ